MRTDTRDPLRLGPERGRASRGLGRGRRLPLPRLGQAECRRSRGRARARGALSMYWFQDIESARALARLYSASPPALCGDGVPQSDADRLPLPGTAAPPIDEPAMDDAEPELREDASVTPCPFR